jgi:hypothetical protein
MLHLLLLLLLAFLMKDGHPWTIVDTKAGPRRIRDKNVQNLGSMVQWHEMKIVIG